MGEERDNCKMRCNGGPHATRDKWAMLGTRTVSRQWPLGRKTWHGCNRFHCAAHAQRVHVLFIIIHSIRHDMLFFVVDAVIDKVN